jgi:hypothetical protein
VFRTGLTTPGAWYASTVAVTLACALFVSNVPGVVFHGLSLEENDHLGLCRLVRLAAHRGDTVLVSGLGVSRGLEAYLPYFEGMRVLVAGRSLSRSVEGVSRLERDLHEAARSGRGPFVLPEWFDPEIRRQLERCAGDLEIRFRDVLAAFEPVERARDEHGRTVWRLAVVTSQVDPNRRARP